MTSTIGIVLRNHNEGRGGDHVQALAIARYLREQGFEVETAEVRALGRRHWALAILFNAGLLPDTAAAAGHCKASGIPYIVFPVYWNLATAVPRGEARRLSILAPANSRRRLVAARLVRGIGGYRSNGSLIDMFANDRHAMREVIRDAVAVCPNSHAELSHLAEYLSVRPDARWQVVRNGIWSRDMRNNIPWVRRRRELIALGGLSPRKNSIALVEAARAANATLRIIGQSNLRGDRYVQRVVRRAGDTVSIEPPLPHSDIPQLLESSRAHAQVGFVETPGLATLEALGCGQSVVVADTPVVREYLGRLSPGVNWTNPRLITSIASAIDAALSNPPDPRLSEHVLAAHDWSVALAPLREIITASVL